MGLTQPPATARSAPPMTPDTLAHCGRLLWRLLHAYADTYPGVATPADQQRARLWLRVWASSVPADGCNCRGGWAELLILSPPDITGRDPFTKWAIAAHDAVNAKLEKRLWSPHISHDHPTYLRLRDHWQATAESRKQKAES